VSFFSFVTMYVYDLDVLVCVCPQQADMYTRATRRHCPPPTTTTASHPTRHDPPPTHTSTPTHTPHSQARARQLLFLEGMWTRFFPTVEAARHVVASGCIGKVVALHADFGFNSSDSEAYPDSPFFRRRLGGGGLLFVGVYPIAMAPLCFGPGMPSRVAAAGVRDEGTGVDLSGGVVLEYAGKGIAVLTYNLMGETPEETTIVGTEGRIKILGPAHCPTRMVVSRKHRGRGAFVCVRGCGGVSRCLCVTRCRHETVPPPPIPFGSWSGGHHQSIDQSPITPPPPLPAPRTTPTPTPTPTRQRGGAAGGFPLTAAPSLRRRRRGLQLPQL
jgi:hypothetical protein